MCGGRVSDDIRSVQVLALLIDFETVVIEVRIPLYRGRSSLDRREAT